MVIWHRTRCGARCWHNIITFSLQACKEFFHVFLQYPIYLSHHKEKDAPHVGYGSSRSFFPSCLGITHELRPRTPQSSRKLHFLFGQSQDRHCPSDNCRQQSIFENSCWLCPLQCFVGKLAFMMLQRAQIARRRIVSASAVETAPSPSMSAARS